MTIGTNDAIEKFGSTEPAVVTSGTSAVTNGAFSAGYTWTNSNDVPVVSAVLECACATAPNANGEVFLHARRLNVQGTNDEEVPSANYSGARVGTFFLKNITTTQYPPLVAFLNNIKSGQEYEFYIENAAGQDISAGWNLYIDGKTVGPKA